MYTVYRDEMVLPDTDKYLNVGTVRTFDEVAPDKDQAKKILEEAAELYGAWDIWRKNQGHGDEIQDIKDEACDLITAVSNLLKSIGVTDIQKDMKACESRNREKGRIA